MSQFFERHVKNHSFFAIEEEGTEFSFRRRCNNEAKDCT
jgi:hypothetical protein